MVVQALEITWYSFVYFEYFCNRLMIVAEEAIYQLIQYKFVYQNKTFIIVSIAVARLSCSSESPLLWQM